MKSPKYFLSRDRRSRSSAALVIVLACIVLLSGLILLFLSQSLLEMQISTASADQTAAAVFARGGVDSVIGELKQEITAGSTTYYTPTDIRDPNCLFLPITNLAMVPARMDPNAPLNVIKESSYNKPFYSGTMYSSAWPAPEWAANFSSTNVDASGRSISMGRWNAPLLMPTLDPSSTNLTPTNGFTPPDWIYMTRAAGPATNFSSSLIADPAGTINTNSVVGRYAYVVYDEGGLLDANAAGYPSSVSAAQVREKASEACADLTQIGLTSSDIDALVSWRNASNSASATLYTNYIYSPNTNAFLTPAPGERVFTSRQQLIDFLEQSVASNAQDVARMQAALPFLTHFSRELNAPSWYPQTNLGSGVYGYYKNSIVNPPTATNAFAPLPRATGSFTDDTNSVTVQQNQSVAFSRFPLSRLSWLGTNGPANGATPAQIQQSFGLAWDPASTNYAWKYVGPTGSTVISSVETLAQVAADKPAREPNFFELLKAAILTGSVNLVPGPQAGSYPGFGGIDDRYVTNSVPIPDEQIMQIGLNAIDQTTTSPLPTRIEFGPNITGDWTGPLYGTKSLPYIYKMIFSPYRASTLPAYVANGISYANQYFTAWEEPVYWDPYQTVNPSTEALDIRIRADGTNVVDGNFGAETTAQNALGNGTNLYVACSPDVPIGPAGNNTSQGGNNGATIELDGSSAALFATNTSNPVMLSSLMTNGYTPSFNDKRAMNPLTWPGQANADVYTEGGCTYAGYWLGDAPAPDYPTPGYATNQVTGQPQGYSQAVLTSGTVPYFSSIRYTEQFVLEAKYGSTFLEVQRMRFSPGVNAAVQEDDNFTALQRRLNLFTISDPRTGRFSFECMQPADYNPSQPMVYPVTAADIADQTLTTFSSVTNNAFAGGTQPGGWMAGITRTVISGPTLTFTPALGSGANPSGWYINSYRWADNTAGSASQTTPIYKDADLAQRPGDGWWNSATANTLPMREDGQQYRPVLLNRSYESVGELGYIFRDTPWRSLNFSSTNSPDAGVLDFFCLNDGYAGNTTAPPVVGGEFNINTPHPEVLQAMLNGAARAQLFPAYDVTAADATNMADAITNITWNTANPTPLMNKSELATRLAPNDPTVQPTATSEPGIDTNIKERREVMVRALASAGQVRTWNLMIDVIAQTGHLPPGSAGFNNFTVSAEQRYWAHVAIDRYTGQVVSMQLEPVSQ